LQGTDELGCKPPSVPIEQNHNEHQRQECEGWQSSISET